MHYVRPVIFFFNDTATTEIYTLSLHDALPILPPEDSPRQPVPRAGRDRPLAQDDPLRGDAAPQGHQRVLEAARSEEHTSELQSRQYLVCRLLLEKKQESPAPPSHSAVSYELHH